MERYLVDTTVFIRHFRGDENASRFLRETSDSAISFVTLGELLQGAHNGREAKNILTFASAFAMEWGSVEANKLAIELIERHHSTRGLLMMDALQAAVCISENYAFVTDNRKHFFYLPNLTVLSPDDIF